MTKWKLNFYFLCNILKKHTKLINHAIILLWGHGYESVTECVLFIIQFTDSPQFIFSFQKELLESIEWNLELNQDYLWVHHTLQNSWLKDDARIFPGLALLKNSVQTQQGKQQISCLFTKFEKKVEICNFMLLSGFDGNNCWLCTFFGKFSPPP